MKKVTIPYNFKPRNYQLPLLMALDSGIKRAMVVWHRRCGKDKTFVNITAKEMIKRVGTYNYYLPTLEEARKIIWTGMDKDGFKFIDHFPYDMISRKNEKDMRLEFHNGSALQLIGTDKLSVVGVNPVGCVFSEFSLQNPKAWQLIQPILNENDGWALFNGTPRGHNHMYTMYQRVKDSPEWFTEFLTLDDTNAYPVDKIEREIELGLISRELAQQEYWCSWDVGIQGSYYSNCIYAAREAGRISDRVEVDSSRPVYTAWDLGIDNAMAIWFFQLIGRDVLLVDHYENQNEGLGHYAEVLKDKDYDYGAHFAPWDVAKRESNGITIQRNAEEVGIFFEKVKRTSSVNDDIELVRRLFPKFYFNEKKCEYGINCLTLYHAKMDKRNSTEERPVYLNSPEHDWTSNTADAFRTMARAIELDMVRPSHFGAIGIRRILPGKSNYLDKKPKQEIPLWHTFGKKGMKQPPKRNYLKNNGGQNGSV